MQAQAAPNAAFWKETSASFGTGGSAGASHYRTNFALKRDIVRLCVQVRVSGFGAGRRRRWT
jgi:hypothetical protein